MNKAGKWILILVVVVTAAGYGLYQCVACRDTAVSHELTIHMPTWPLQSLDPAVWAPQVVLTQGTVFEGLFGYDKNLQIVPVVADSWSVSPHQKKWTIKLRKDKKWSNGDAVTAQDFIFGWKRFLSPEVMSPTWASVWPSVVGAMDYKAGTVPFDSVGIAAPDSFTLEIVLIKPRALQGFLALGSALPLHPESFSRAKDKGKSDFWWMPEFFIGNGPYIPESFIRDGEINLVKNPHYVGNRGNVDRFILKAVNMAAQNIQVQQFETGELDVAHVLTLGDYTYASKSRHLKSSLRVTPELGFTGIQVARTVHPLFNDNKLRRAVAMAINKVDLSQNITGGRVLPTSNFGPPDDPLFEGLEGLSFNPEGARKLVKNSSYRGETIYLFSPPSTEIKGLASITEAIQSHLKAVGLNVVMENMEEGMLSTYTWGGGYIDDPRYERPGLILFLGKILWMEPLMLLRAADHIWHWMNLNYPLKELRKKITLERLDLKNQKKGMDTGEWNALRPLRDSLEMMYTDIYQQEKDSIYRNKILEVEYHEQFDRIYASHLNTTDGNKRIEMWRSSKDLLLDGMFNFSTYYQNRGNYKGNVVLAHLERMEFSDSALVPMIREIFQEAMEECWIMPLFSEKLVYLKSDFIEGEVINKFGMWNMLFNLHSIKIDKEKYYTARGGHTL